MNAEHRFRVKIHTIINHSRDCIVNEQFVIVKFVIVKFVIVTVQSCVSGSAVTCALRQFLYASNLAPTTVCDSQF